MDEYPSRYLTTRTGVVAEATSGDPRDGLVLTDRDCTILIASLPVSSLNHPRFAAMLTGRGIYRLEDSSGRRVRVGQGRILQRLRAHLRYSIFRPMRVIAARPAVTDWSDAERLYLEARFAAESSALGLELVSFVFSRNFDVPRHARDSLDRTLDRVLQLIACADRLCGDDAVDFGLDTKPPVEWDRLFRHVGDKRPQGALKHGAPLFYEDGWIAASAIVIRGQVILEQGSLVYLRLGPSVGSLFAQLHEYFLLEAGTVPINSEVGRTTRLVSQPTAAALIKRVTGGRVHNADRWQRIPRPATDSSSGEEER